MNYILYFKLRLLITHFSLPTFAKVAIIKSKRIDFMAATKIEEKISVKLLNNTRQY